MYLRILFVTFFFLGNFLFAQEKEQEIIIKSIYFGGGSYIVDQAQKKELEEFIAEVEDLNHYQVIVFSHTDNIGGKEYNEWLSKMRSMTVYEILIQIPVPEEQVKINNFGMENPLYNNKSHLGRRANRRVDVVLMPVVF